MEVDSPLLRTALSALYCIQYNDLITCVACIGIKNIFFGQLPMCDWVTFKMNQITNNIFKITQFYFVIKNLEF